MQLNKNRAFGTVIGHESARYEQDGLLFDGAGKQLGEFIAPKPAAKPGPKPKIEQKLSQAADNATLFLQNILSGGPIDKSVVFKEAENNLQNWDEVKNAFIRMGGKTSKRGEATLWSMSYEKTK